MREEAIIDGAEEGEGKKRRKWRARWRYRWRGGGTRQGNGNARRTEYRVGWSSEVARVRGKGFAERDLQVACMPRYTLPLSVSVPCTL